MTLPDTYWIGGGSGAGKSTIAHRLSTAYGLRVVSTDDLMADHTRRTRPADTPLLQRFLAMDLDERWVRRSPAEMLATFHWFAGEGFDLVVEDLRRLPPGPPVVVEGFRLLPRLVRPLLPDPGRAVWLLPTPGFRRAAFARRGGLWTVAGRTTDPEAALHNLLERDRMFTDELAAETARLGLTAIPVDAACTEDALTARVAADLGLPSRKTGH